MKAVHVIAFILVIVGGLNWGIMGVSGGYNLVGSIFGGLSNIVYILVGLSALVLVFTHKKDCKCCESKMAAPTM